jgi:hypothetical protein
MNRPFIKKQPMFNVPPSTSKFPGIPVDDPMLQGIPVVQSTVPGANPNWNDIYSRQDKQQVARYNRALSSNLPLPSQQVQDSNAPGRPFESFPNVAQMPLAPNPMTPEEIEEYYRKPRRTPVSHPFLKKAKACINCIYFLAYERGKDSKHLNLCRYLGVSPWNENFTCAGSFCDIYDEKGKEKREVKVVPLPIPKKRKRRTKAEIETDAKKSELEKHNKSNEIETISVEVSHTEDLMAELANAEIVPEEPLVNLQEPKPEVTKWLGGKKNKTNENSDVDSRITFGKVETNT